MRHNPGTPSKNNPGQHRTKHRIANTNPGRSNPVLPSKLPCITDENYCGKIRSTIGKRRKSRPYIPPAQNKSINIGGMSAAVKPNTYHHSEKNNQHTNFNQHFLTSRFGERILGCTFALPASLIHFSKLKFYTFIRQSK